MPLYSVAQKMSARVWTPRGKAQPAEEHSKDFPDSVLWVRFSVSGRRAATKFDHTRAVDVQKVRTLNLVGPELVASPSSRRTSVVVMAWFAKAFDTADLTEAKG